MMTPRSTASRRLLRSTLLPWVAALLLVSAGVASADSKRWVVCHVFPYQDVQNRLFFSDTFVHRARGTSAMRSDLGRFLKAFQAHLEDFYGVSLPIKMPEGFSVIRGKKFVKCSERCWRRVIKQTRSCAAFRTRHGALDSRKKIISKVQRESDRVAEIQRNRNPLFWRTIESGWVPSGGDSHGGLEPSEAAAVGTAPPSTVASRVAATGIPAIVCNDTLVAPAERRGGPEEFPVGYGLEFVERHPASGKRCLEALAVAAERRAQSNSRALRTGSVDPQSQHSATVSLRKCAFGNCVLAGSNFGIRPAAEAVGIRSSRALGYRELFPVDFRNGAAQQPFAFRTRLAFPVRYVLDLGEFWAAV